LFVFFLFICFPMIDLLGVPTVFENATFIANQATDAASVSSDYDAALAAATGKATTIASSGFGKFAKLVAVGGFANTGVNLWVTRTNINNSQSDGCGPNQYTPSPIDSQNYVYEYSAHVKYTIGPFINLGGVPFIGTVPGLGQPVTGVFVSHKNAEFPDGMATGANGLGTGSWSSYSGAGGGGSSARF